MNFIYYIYTYINNNMFEHLRCSNCGNDIGSIYCLFREMKQHLYLKELAKNKTQSNNIQLDNNINIDLQEIFDILHVPRYCCRNRMATTIQYDSLLYNNYNE